MPIIDLAECLLIGLHARTGLTAECQRKVSLALKRARYMGLMPYVT